MTELADPTDADLAAPLIDELNQSDVELREIDAAYKALKTVAKRVPTGFGQAISMLEQLRTNAQLRFNMARRDYVDQVLSQLADEAYTNSAYPIMHANKQSMFGVSGQQFYSNNLRNIEKEKIPTDHLTADLKWDGPGQGYRAVSAYELEADRLVETGSWLRDRVRTKRFNDEKKRHAAARKLSDAQFAVMEALDAGEDPGKKAVVSKLVERGLIDDKHQITDLGQEALRLAQAKVKPKQESKPQLKDDAYWEKHEQRRQAIDERARQIVSDL